VLVEDLVSGCETTVSLAIPEAPPIAVGILSATNNDCQTFGAVEVNAGGGNGPFSYTWNTNPVQTGTVLDSVPSGTYSLTVTDQSGCVTTAPITMAGPQSPVNLALINSQDASSCLQNDGSITVLAAGDGTIAYNWLMTPPQTGATLSNLYAGSYEVEALSSTGCSDTLGITIGPVCPLASEIIQFHAYAGDKQAVLQWEIAQNSWDLLYIIERSVNGLDFEPIASLQAEEQLGEISYQTVDQQVNQGKTYFYRLVMENFSGDQTLSKLREVHFASEVNFNLLGLYPNPTKGEFNVEFFIKNRSNIQLELFDLRGDHVNSWKLAV